MSHKKFGPDRFSRFDVYWMQTNKQTDRQTNRQAKFIYTLKGVNTCFLVNLTFLEKHISPVPNGSLSTFA